MSSIRFPIEEYQFLRAKAQRDGESITALVLRAVRMLMEQDKKVR
jgi:hypothetical protein